MSSLLVLALAVGVVLVLAVTAWWADRPCDPGSPAERIDELEPTFDKVETELFDHLQALEYRLPYTPPPEWPRMECDHEWNTISSVAGYSFTSCSKCGDSAEQVRGSGTSRDPYKIRRVP